MMTRECDLAAVLVENAELRDEVESLHAALGVKQARADYRDSAKREVAQVLELSEGAPIHEIISAIRALLTERDRLRRLLTGKGE